MTVLAARPENPPTARSRRRRAPLYVLTASALGVGLAGLIAFNHHPATAASPAPPTPALTVTSAAPLQTTWPTTLQASGGIAAWQEASIGAQVGGYRLIDVQVNVGDRVRKGQTLARLDPALLRADEAQLQASEDQALANRRRLTGLESSGAVSDQDVLQAVTSEKTAGALLAAKRLQLRYTDIQAPDDGVISARTATLGAVPSSGQELFRLIRQSRLEWRGEMTAAQLAQIAIGQSIALSLPDGTVATARVRQTAPSLDPHTRLGLIYADLAPGGTARAGMFAGGRIVLSHTPALTVPADSVVIRDGRSYVLKILDKTATPRVSLQPVTVGRRQGDATEILSGVGATDRVVVRGAGFLNDGDVVRLADSAAAAPGVAR